MFICDQGLKHCQDRNENARDIQQGCAGLSNALMTTIGTGVAVGNRCDFRCGIEIKF